MPPPIRPHAQYGLRQAVIGGALRSTSCLRPSPQRWALLQGLSGGDDRSILAMATTGRAFFGGSPDPPVRRPSWRFSNRDPGRWKPANARLHGASAHSVEDGYVPAGQGNGARVPRDTLQHKRNFLVPATVPRASRRLITMLFEQCPSTIRGCGATRRPSASVSYTASSSSLAIAACYDAIGPWTGEFLSLVNYPATTSVPEAYATVRCSPGHR